MPESNDSLSPAPITTPMLGPTGLPASPWALWFQKLGIRIGGGNTVPLDQTNATVATFEGRLDEIDEQIHDLEENKQDKLGFTPVQQGGGAGQLDNKVYIGWSGTGLKAQVDASDLGEFVFTNALSGLLSSGPGWISLAGYMIQWGITPVLNPNDTRTFSFNVDFPTTCLGVNVSCMSAWFNQGRTVYTRGWTSSTFTCGANGNDCQIFWIAIGN